MEGWDLVGGCLADLKLGNSGKYKRWLDFGLAGWVRKKRARGSGGFGSTSRGFGKVSSDSNDGFLWHQWRHLVAPSCF